MGTSKIYIIDDETGERLLWANPFFADELTKSQKAYFVMCYKELIFMPQKLRNRRIAQIKAEALSLQHQLGV